MVFFYLLTVCLVLYGIFLYQKEKKQHVKKRMESAFRTPAKTVKEQDRNEEKAGFSTRVIAPIWKQLKRSFQKNLTNEKSEKIEIKLQRAGNPFGITPVEFRIIQIALFLGLPTLFGVYGLLLGLNQGMTFSFLAIGLFIASFFPNYYLKQKTEARNKQALRELPDFLDLVTVSIEAGLGFDSALSKVVTKKPGILSIEFQRCLEEMRLGKSRREALSGVRERVVVPDIRALIGSIIQAEQLGIGMVTILRAQSVEIRERRKQRAEEEAMKAPIKMLFPLVIFIFPTIFIILLGPAVIKMMGSF
ncbi:type II secretion system F family protein [Aquibacillus sediminis]|uniref:type II secretion system F family protein n=1 Tax=Aquibacillus sediminis TaxID=2574734 RepID=UPI0011083EC1|nr:type II secretion system F family protein [Aquibacillus sediminis]